MPDLSFEILHGMNDGMVICGVDEVGRGPLAGPVIAAAFILSPSLPPSVTALIRDSKKTTTKLREELFGPLTEHCQHAVAEASVAEIDELNILHASMLAMRRAIEKLDVVVDMALIDGNRVPKMRYKAVAVIGGDDKSLSIAAASIVAKVTRDRLMAKLAAEHPGYGWERNAGYATAEHLAALRALGATAWHRDSFAPVSQLKLATS